eukprot:13580442-Alexandrium_andersonii.AAC.1
MRNLRCNPLAVLTPLPLASELASTAGRSDAAEPPPSLTPSHLACMAATSAQSWVVRSRSARRWWGERDAERTT